MELTHLTYQGPPIDDHSILEKLPANLRGFLEQVNGFIQFAGGLHIRGACQAPDWHSLAEIWSGSLALSRLYPTIADSDIPFGQDALGDQFILREGVVHRLMSETGEITSLDCDFFGFLQSAQNDPLEYLGLHPLIQFQNEGGELKPSQLLSAYPPFCTTQAASGVSLKAISAVERVKFLADFAAQISNFADGTNITIKVSD
jgi:hypothetical protein